MTARRAGSPGRYEMAGSWGWRMILTGDRIGDLGTTESHRFLGEMSQVYWKYVEIACIITSLLPITLKVFQWAVTMVDPIYRQSKNISFCHDGPLEIPYTSLLVI